MHQDSAEYRNTRRIVEYFSDELNARNELGKDGVMVLMSGGRRPQFALQRPRKDAAAELGMDAATARSTFMRAVRSGLIAADFGSSGPDSDTAKPWVSHITPKGLTMLDQWEEPSQPQSSVFHISGDTYGSNIGTQQYAQIFQPQFTFSDLEHEIERYGGEDIETLKAMVEDVRNRLGNQESIEGGSLANWSELINRHSWITQPIAQLLLLYALTGQVAG